MPLWAIADGNQITEYPTDLEVLNEIEKQLVARIHCVNYFSTVKGGGHSCIKSHTYYVECTASPVVNSLPRATTHYVTLVGHLTPIQKAVLKKKEEASLVKMKAYTEYMQMHNIAQKDLAWDNKFKVEDVIIDACGLISEKLDLEEPRHHQVATNVIEHGTEHTKLISFLGSAQETAQDNLIIVKKSNSYVYPKDSYFFEYAFPWLFPVGSF